jgi:hypothetical protein
MPSTLERVISVSGVSSAALRRVLDTAQVTIGEIDLTHSRAPPDTHKAHVMTLGFNIYMSARGIDAYLCRSGAFAIGLAAKLELSRPDGSTHSDSTRHLLHSRDITQTSRTHMLAYRFDAYMVSLTSHVGQPWCIFMILLDLWLLTFLCQRTMHL